MDVELNPDHCMIEIHQILQIEVLPKNNDCLVIAVWGQIRQDAVINFKSEMVNIIEENSSDDVTLDFSKVDFIDSQGLAVIYELFLLLKGKGRKFEIINASANIANLFLLTRLHRLFSIR